MIRGNIRLKFVCLIVNKNIRNCCYSRCFSVFFLLEVHRSGDFSATRSIIDGTVNQTLRSKTQDKVITSLLQDIREELAVLEKSKNMDTFGAATNLSQDIIAKREKMPHDITPPIQDSTHHKKPAKKRTNGGKIIELKNDVKGTFTA